LSQWAPGGRGPRCFAPAAQMVIMPLHKRQNIRAVCHWVKTVYTGVHLSNILFGGNQCIGGQVVISDESVDISQLLGARPRAGPQSLRL